MAKAATEQGFFTAEWFPYKHERFEASDKVALMSLAEEGAYHRVIRLAWKYRSLSSDPAVLAAKIGKRCTPRIAEKVLTTFVKDPERPSTHVIHPVVEEIREEQYQKYKNRVKGGKAAHATNGKEKTSSISPAELEQCLSITPIESDLKIRDLKRLIAACVREHAGVDERLVEIAVRETVLRRKGSANENKPIKSAKYFAEEISKLNALSGKGGKEPMADRTIDVLLKRRREQTGDQE
jgi:hypothetical protein